MATISQRKRAKVLIHGAAVAAGAASGALAQGGIIALDTPILGVIYIGLIEELGELFHQKVTKECGAALLAEFGGFSVGLFGVKAVLGFLPGIGNLANAGISTATTEAMGWSFFNYFDGKD
jgi:uncharacterized protein (DUF697 family)